MLRISKILLLALLIPSCVLAQDETDVIVDSGKDSIVVLNDQLRRTSRRLRDLEGGISLTTGVTGILPTANGGTGANLSSSSQGAVPYFGSTGVIASLSAGTNGQFLKTQGVSANPIWENVTYGSVAGSYSSGSYLLAQPSSFVVTSGEGSSYQKRVEMVVPRSGTLTIKFYITNSDGSVTQYGKIYRNGVAVGTERSLGGPNTSDFSEDISGWTAGDLLQLYTKQSATSGNQAVGAVRAYSSSVVNEVYSTGGFDKGITIYSGNAAPSALGNGINSLGTIGDMYINTNGGASTTLYVKTGASTWTAK